MAFAAGDPRHLLFIANSRFEALFAEGFFLLMRSRTLSFRPSRHTHFAMF